MINKNFRKELQRLIPFSFIAIVSIVSTVPAFTGGKFKLNYDGQFHLARFEDVYMALLHFRLPPLVNLIGLSQHGLAVNGMYPWLTGLIFIIPKFFIHNYMYALGTGFFILNFLTMFCVYWLTRYVTRNIWIQVLGISLYQFNAYHLTLMYSRIALGEAIAYMLLPVVLLGCLKIWNKDPNGWLYLGLGMGAIANTHVLSLIMAAGLIFSVETVRIFQRKLDRTEFLAYLKAGGLSVLSGFYSLVNIYWLSSRNLLNNPSGPWVTIKPNVLLQALLNNSIVEDANSFNIGFLPVLVLIIFTGLLFTSREGSWRIWTVAAFISFISTFSWFPWQLVANQITFVSIQFLGRFLSFTALFLTMAVVCYFEEQKIKTKDISFAITFLVMITGICAVHSYHGEKTNDGFKVWVNAEQLKSSTYSSFLGNDYAPLNNKKERLSALVQSAGIKMEVKKQSYNKLQLRLTVSKNGNYSLPIARYTGVRYRAVLNGKKILSLGKKNIKLKLLKGTNDFSLSSEAPASSYITMAISLLATFGGVLMLLRRFFRPKIEKKISDNNE
ncbi:hypothetical protein [Liquorilactobacillus uvarum]|uniref:Membrane protein 6-pyruvoyl-tetrahydropterin synthase-related domain-containing protein n=1 Tax=Liquorilactobacillus uvarum DSM 19971 TaxID=1423812 RepID=A0A0R1Q7D9_9LACO|nr:hypothetical protein [Liquorilactobacillus uvarum]KRL38261.1 hypothetical protein FD20_GL001874 [Liquorilactobacillus uvarum DSM 19971]